MKILIHKPELTINPQNPLKNLPKGILFMNSEILKENIRKTNHSITLLNPTPNFILWDIIYLAKIETTIMVIVKEFPS